jgi:hypothetical protein
MTTEELLDLINNQKIAILSLSRRIAVLEAQLLTFKIHMLAASKIKEE